MREGGDNEAYERRGCRREIGLLDKVCVDDGVKQVVIDGIVDMGVLVVVDPERSNN